MKFQRATREKSFLRFAISGIAGAGKTFTAMTLAHYLADGKPVAVLDTEAGSSKKYASNGDADPERGLFTFDCLVLDTYSPLKYVEAINAAKSDNYPILVIDGLSQAWDGVDGALEQVDKITRKTSSTNTYFAWRDVTPMHRRLVESILTYPGHVIATMREKPEYVVEQNDKGKMVPKRVGTAPVQRAGMEHEFDVFATIDSDHNLIITKSRCFALDGQVINRPGKDVAETLIAWLDDGVAPTLETPIYDSSSAILDSQISQLKDKVRPLTGFTPVKWQAFLNSRFGIKQSANLTQGQFHELNEELGTGACKHWFVDRPSVDPNSILLDKSDLKRLFVNARKQPGYSDEVFHAWILERYGCESTQKLNRGQLSEIIKLCAAALNEGASIFQSSEESNQRIDDHEQAEEQVEQGDTVHQGLTYESLLDSLNACESLEEVDQLWESINDPDILSDLLRSGLDSTEILKKDFMNAQARLA